MEAAADISKDVCPCLQEPRHVRGVSVPPLAAADPERGRAAAGPRPRQGQSLAAAHRLEQQGLQLLPLRLQVADRLAAVRDEPDAGPQEDADDGDDGGGGGGRGQGGLGRHLQLLHPGRPRATRQ